MLAQKYFAASSQIFVYIPNIPNIPNICHKNQSAITYFGACHFFLSFAKPVHP
jgi:hypothetical protein